jgi:uncharacterized protein with ParB-like and HNH nuclease domain
MARTTFSAQSKNIGELLGGNDPSKLVVPEFQRGYSWEKKHVAAFWKDIIDPRKMALARITFLGQWSPCQNPRMLLNYWMDSRDSPRRRSSSAS